MWKSMWKLQWTKPCLSPCPSQPRPWPHPARVQINSMWQNESSPDGVKWCLREFQFQFETVLEIGDVRQNSAWYYSFINWKAWLILRLNFYLWSKQMYLFFSFSRFVVWWDDLFHCVRISESCNCSNGTIRNCLLSAVFVVRAYTDM